MARAEYICDKEMFYQVSFESVIRGHHVYKANWAPIMNEKLTGKEDDRDEAKANDRFAIGIFKPVAENLQLVGHAPIELSALLFHFLNNEEGNVLNAYPTGKRFREIGLSVPARYRALTRNKKTASVLMEELKKKEDTLLLKLKVDNKDIMLLPVSM